MIEDLIIFCLRFLLEDIDHLLVVTGLEYNRACTMGRRSSMWLWQCFLAVLYYWSCGHLSLATDDTITNNNNNNNNNKFHTQNQKRENHRGYILIDKVPPNPQILQNHLRHHKPQASSLFLDATNKIDTNPVVSTPEQSPTSTLTSSITDMTPIPPGPTTSALFSASPIARHTNKEAIRMSIKKHSSASTTSTSSSDGKKIKPIKKKLPNSAGTPVSSVREYSYDFTHQQRKKHVRASHLRKNTSNKPYYSGRPIDFLREYGMYYRLFDQFFNTSMESVIAEKVVGGLMGGFDGTWHGSSGIETTHATRDYSLLSTKLDTTAKLMNTSHYELNFEYVTPIHDVEIIRFNNRFRFGDDINDRFMTIGFDVDPWLETTEDGKYYIYFVGLQTGLPLANYTCDFSYPEVVQSVVEIEYNTINVYDMVTKNNIIRCSLPPTIVQAVNHRLPHIVLNFTQHIMVDVNITTTSTYGSMTTTIQELQSRTLLWDITLSPSHYLDKRNFHYSLQTMVDNLEDPMLHEWLVYNIMLGVDHFYIYYNAVTSVGIKDTSKLRPFLDANIVTLIYYPYHHTVHFNCIQHSGLNSHLRNYGGYNRWVGYWDVDEYFLPSEEILEQLGHNNTSNNATHNSLLRHLVYTFATHSTSAIIFNSMEMECEPEVASYNYYNGGNNVLEVHVDIFNTSITTVHSDAVVASKKRVAVTTHCPREGFVFLESQKGHGKMLIRPSVVYELSSPHRLNQDNIVWTTPDNTGLIRHFNRFRYTAVLVARKHYNVELIESRDTLRSFTLLQLKELLGVSGRKVTALPAL